MEELHKIYEAKSKDYDELSNTFQAYQEQSRLIIEEIETENSQLRAKILELESSLRTNNESNKKIVCSLNRELEKTTKIKIQAEQDNRDLRDQIVELQNTTDSLESQLRAANSILSQYQDRVEKTMEELAILQLQLQFAKEASQEKTARLKTQLKETEEELFVLRAKGKKYNYDSESRMLKMSRIIYKKRRFTTIIGVNNNLPLDPNFAALLANHHVQCACPNSEDFSDKENISVPDSLNTEKSTKTLEQYEGESSEKTIYKKIFRKIEPFTFFKKKPGQVSLKTSRVDEEKQMVDVGTNTNRVELAEEERDDQLPQAEEHQLAQCEEINKQIPVTCHEVTVEFAELPRVVRGGQLPFSDSKEMIEKLINKLQQKEQRLAAKGETGRKHN